MKICNTFKDLKVAQNENFSYNLNALCHPRCIHDFLYMNTNKDFYLTIRHEHVEATKSTYDPHK